MVTVLTGGRGVNGRAHSLSLRDTTSGQAYKVVATGINCAQYVQGGVAPEHLAELEANAVTIKDDVGDYVTIDEEAFVLCP